MRMDYAGSVSLLAHLPVLEPCRHLPEPVIETCLELRPPSFDALLKLGPDAHAFEAETLLEHPRRTSLLREPCIRFQIDHNTA